MTTADDRSWTRGDGAAEPRRRGRARRPPAVRPGLGGVAAQPRGDAAPRRGAARAPAPARPSGRRRRRRRPLGLPDRPVAPAGGDPAQLPDDRVRLHGGGPRRDPAAQRAPPRDRRAGLRARDPDLSLWVHATLVDSTIAVYDAWLEPLPAARRAAYYAGDATDRTGLRCPRGDAPGRPRGVRDDTWRRCSAPTGPVHPSPAARELAGVVLAPATGALLPVPAGAAAASWPDPGRRLRLDAVAVGRAAAGRPSARTTGCPGVPCERLGVGLARRRLARLATRPCRPTSGRWRKALAADRRVAGPHAIPARP